jgi:hypothetical protein
MDGMDETKVDIFGKIKSFIDSIGLVGIMMGLIILTLIFKNWFNKKFGSILILFILMGSYAYADETPKVNENKVEQTANVDKVEQLPQEQPIIDEQEQVEYAVPRVPVPENFGWLRDVIREEVRRASVGEIVEARAYEALINTELRVARTMQIMEVRVNEQIKESLLSRLMDRGLQLGVILLVGLVLIRLYKVF